MSTFDFMRCWMIESSAPHLNESGMKKRKLIQEIGLSMGWGQASPYYRLFLDFKDIEYLYNRSRTLGISGRFWSLIEYKARKILTECHSIMTRAYYQWVLAHCTYPWMWWNKQGQLVDDFQEKDKDNPTVARLANDAPHSLSSAQCVGLWVERLGLHTKKAFLKMTSVKGQVGSPVVFRSPGKRMTDLTMTLEEEFGQGVDGLVRKLRRRDEVKVGGEVVTFEQFSQVVREKLMVAIPDVYGGWDAFISVEFFDHFPIIRKFFDEKLLPYKPKGGDMVAGFLLVDDALHHDHKYGRMGNHIALSEDELDSLGDLGRDPINSRDEAIEFFIDNFDLGDDEMAVLKDVRESRLSHEYI